ncbi:MAG: hypothetical protein CL912_10570 [Deltaproteobacteria bacterium]|nr:hypothetical protein [Deltaproteobacteria bacterium]
MAPLLEFNVSIWSFAEELQKAFMIVLDRKTEQLRWRIYAKAEAGKSFGVKGMNVIPLCEVYLFQQYVSKHRS